MIVDFDRTRFAAVEDSIRAYWTARHVDVVRFIPSTAAASISQDPSQRAGVLLYGTFDLRADNPVFLAYRDTWLERLEQEATRFDSQEGIGLIAAGKNPYAPGFIGVFAAPSPELLPGLHAHFGPSHSLVTILDGDLYVLVGPETFSSAGMFAATVKDYQLGVLIGEETGATRQGFGETLSVRLPNSGLGFQVSCKQWFAPVPHPGDSRRGTVPDVPVDEAVLESYPDADDPVLSFALDHIAERAR